MLKPPSAYGSAASRPSGGRTRLVADALALVRSGGRTLRSPRGLSDELLVDARTTTCVGTAPRTPHPARLDLHRVRVARPAAPGRPWRDARYPTPWDLQAYLKP